MKRYYLKTLLNKSFLALAMIAQMQAFSQSNFVELLGRIDTIDHAVPEGWKMLSSANGDLNQDGVMDIAIVIENTDKNNIKVNESSIGRPSINLNPRILGIFFGTISGGYKKQLQSNTFILLQDSPTMEEPLKGIEITKHGFLKIEFGLWYSAGSWASSNHKYFFKFLKNDFLLTDYEADEMHRGTGDSTNYEINFLTGNMGIEYIEINDDATRTSRVELIEFELEMAPSLRSLGKPFEWKFNGIHI